MPLPFRQPSSSPCGGCPAWGAAPPAAPTFVSAWPLAPLQVVLASACSGHGFKFAPVIGSILADLALSPGGRSGHDADIALHRLSRGRPGQAEVLDALLGQGQVKVI